jgi:hypothetical protein
MLKVTLRFSNQFNRMNVLRWFSTSPIDSHSNNQSNDLNAHQKSSTHHNIIKKPISQPNQTSTPIKHTTKTIITSNKPQITNTHSTEADFITLEMRNTSRNLLYIFVTIYGSILGLAIAFLVQDDDNSRNERLEIHNSRKDYLNSTNQLSEFILEYGDELTKAREYSDASGALIDVPRYAAVYQWINDPQIIENPTNHWFPTKVPVDYQRKQVLDLNTATEFAYDYWTLVQAHCEMYGCSANDSTVKTWTEQHKSFVQYLKPLNQVSKNGKQTEWLFEPSNIFIRPSRRTKPHIRFFKLILSIFADDDGTIPQNGTLGWINRMLEGQTPPFEP